MFKSERLTQTPLKNTATEPNPQARAPLATHGSLLSYVSLHRYPCPRDRPRLQRAQRAAQRPTGCNHFAQQREEIAKQRRALLSAFGIVAVRGGLDRFDRRPDLPTSGPDTRQNTGKAGFGRRILATWRCPADDLERHRTERPLPHSVRASNATINASAEVA
jgi:hypothetical protein